MPDHGSDITITGNIETTRGVDAAAVAMDGARGGVVGTIPTDSFGGVDGAATAFIAGRCRGGSGEGNGGAIASGADWAGSGATGGGVGGATIV